MIVGPLVLPDFSFVRVMSRCMFPKQPLPDALCSDQREPPTQRTQALSAHSASGHRLRELCNRHEVCIYAMISTRVYPIHQNQGSKHMRNKNRPISSPTIHHSARPLLLLCTPTSEPSFQPGWDVLLTRARFTLLALVRSCYGDWLTRWIN